MKFFIAQTLANRTERDRVLRARNDLAMFFVGIASGRREERADAVWALMHCANPRTTKALEKLARSRDTYQRETAVLALAKMATVEIVARRVT